ncbi:MAG: hypothetical protein JXO49_10370 [Deltaproteobacteria bacterium]|nr:hypothetical protein [Candidatus Anaeroferrophillus wilburensis]MBN2889735.1 hypothetical protein [Deltaproteobacteria bacterium]
MPESKLDIAEVVALKRQEIGGEENDVLKRLELSTQSIYHRAQFCEYHYSVLEEIVSEKNLVLDRLGVYRRSGDTVAVRFVYEANIFAFIQNLHALLDSFPYVLNLFFPVTDPESSDVTWNKKFMAKYRGFSFGGALKSFCVNEEFQLLRGYTNAMKHRTLLRVKNNWRRLEFEEITYEGVSLDSQGGFCRTQKTAPEVNVMDYLVRCHDSLIPAYFRLWEEVKIEKINVLSSAT